MGLWKLARTLFQSPQQLEAEPREDVKKHEIRPGRQSSRHGVLTRIEFRDDCTIGRLELPECSLWTLEPPWKDNQINASCIPLGTYPVVRRLSPHFGECWHLLNTSPRQYILIHSGNIPKHTKGCILPGRRRGWIGGKRAVLNSKSALREVVNKPFTLEIVEK